MLSTRDQTEPLRGLPRPFGWTVAILLALPSAAWAQAAEKQLSVLAMDAERPTELLVRSMDPNAGTSLQVVEVPTGTLKKGWFVETKRDEGKRIKRLTRKRFAVKAIVDQVEPKGRFTILGAPDRSKKHYQVLALRDGRIGVLGVLDLEKSEDGGEYARGMLKEVIWAPGGKTIIVVLNQKLEYPDGPRDVDSIHFVTFRPWKVKWIHPEGDGDGATPK